MVLNFSASEKSGSKHTTEAQSRASGMSKRRRRRNNSQTVYIWYNGRSIAGRINEFVARISCRFDVWLRHEHFYATKQSMKNSHRYSSYFANIYTEMFARMWVTRNEKRTLFVVSSCIFRLLYRAMWNHVSVVAIPCDDNCVGIETSNVNKMMWPCPSNLWFLCDFRHEQQTSDQQLFFKIDAVSAPPDDTSPNKIFHSNCIVSPIFTTQCEM